MLNEQLNLDVLRIVKGFKHASLSDDFPNGRNVAGSG